MSGQNLLIGEWKPVKVTMYNAFSKKTLVVYDDNNTEAVKGQLLKNYILEHRIDSANLNKDSEASKSIIDRQFTKLDSNDFKNKLDSRFLKYESAKLIFKKDSIVDIDSYGLITPSAVPGRAFGDRLKGVWTSNADRLKMIVSKKNESYPFFYKIIRLTNDELVLGMTTEDYGQAYMTLELTKQ